MLGQKRRPWGQLIDSHGGQYKLAEQEPGAKVAAGHVGENLADGNLGYPWAGVPQVEQQSEEQRLAVLLKEVGLVGPSLVQLA